MNPIIFLDFDGVLNSRLYTKRLIASGTLGSHTELDPEAVSLLNDLCAATRAKVVITASVRKIRTMEEVEEMLTVAGFTGEIIGKTDSINFRGGLRGNEVYLWVEDHPIECGSAGSVYDNYVILDDDSDFLYWQRNNLIITDPHCGITPKTVFLAKRILKVNDHS